MKKRSILCGAGLIVLSVGFALVPMLSSSCLAGELAAECEAMVKAPSVGPAPAALVERCGAEQQVKANLAPAPSVVFDNSVFGVEAVSAYSLAQFPLTDPASLQLFPPFAAGSFVSGCDFDNSGFYEKLYCVDSSSPAEFFSMNTTDGTKNTIGSSSPSGAESFTSLSMDQTSGIMYATSSACSASSSLYTIDLKTGQASLVGAISAGSCIVSSGVDNKGNLFGVDLVSDSLILIDKATGAGTVIGPLGYDANFGQGMDCDERTGTCFLFAFNAGTFQPELRTCDTNTGATTLLGRIGGLDLRQIGGAGITKFTWPKFRPATSGVKVAP